MNTAGTGKPKKKKIIMAGIVPAAAALLFCAGRARAAAVDISAGPGEAEVVSVSPDGRRLAAGGRSGVVRVWDAAAGKILWRLKGRSGAITAVAFSRDGRQIVSGSDKGELVLWDLDAGASRGFALANAAVWGAAFMAPGQVSFVKADGAFQGWDFTRSAGAGGWQAITAPAFAAGISADGLMSAFSGRERDLVLRCSPLKENTSDSKGGLPQARRIALSGNGGIGIYSVDSGAIRAFHCFSKKPFMPDTALSGGGAPGAPLALSPDGALAAAGGSGGSVKLWDTANGGLVFDWSGTAEVRALAFLADGKQLLAGSADGTLRLREVPSKREMTAYMEEAARADEAARDAREEKESAEPEPSTGSVRYLYKSLLFAVAALLLLLIWRFISGALAAGCLLLLIGFGLFALTFGFIFPREINRRNGENSVVHSLGVFRGALESYRKDNGGRCPTHLWRLVSGKYIGGIPELWNVSGDSFYPGVRPDVPHPYTRRVAHYKTFAPRDTGKWGYVDDPQDKNYGMLFIDCTHTDTRGFAWSSY